MYTAADRILGRLVKVTPSSKVVGDLALHLVGLNADPADFNENPQKYDVPDSVIGFLSGELGDPPGGWPEPFRTKALQGRTVQGPRRGAQRRGQRRAQRRFQDPPAHAQPAALRRPHQGLPEERRVLRQPFGAGHRDYLFGLQRGAEHEIELEKGVRLIASLEAVVRAGREGHAHRHVHAQRPVPARGGPRPFRGEATSRPPNAPTPPSPGQVAAPFAGAVTLTVKVGDTVKAGDTVATIEAMKMEASITTPVAGTVGRLAVGAVEQVQGGDLLLVVRPGDTVE